MKTIIIIEDTVSANGPGADIQFLTDPQMSSEELMANQTQALMLGKLAIQTISGALELATSFAGLNPPVHVQSPQINLTPPRNNSEG